MRCIARVGESTLDIRASGDTSLRCQRAAHYPPGRPRVCYQHRDAYRKHREIVQTILAIRPNPPLSP